MALPYPARPFSVVCDVDFAIDCAILKDDPDGHELVVVESCQLQAAEKKYPVHEKYMLAMEYSKVNPRVHLLGSKPFVIYTDHASLRAETHSPHIVQKLSRWIFFFA